LYQSGGKKTKKIKTPPFGAPDRGERRGLSRGGLASWGAPDTRVPSGRGCPGSRGGPRFFFAPPAACRNLQDGRQFKKAKPFGPEIFGTRGFSLFGGGGPAPVYRGGAAPGERGLPESARKGGPVGLGSWACFRRWKTVEGGGGKGWWARGAAGRRWSRCAHRLKGR